MKIITLFCLISLGFFCECANAQLYIVSVHLRGNPATYDSVYVYSPTGEATGYKIDRYAPTHFKQLNVILNSVIDKGYKLLDVVITNLNIAEEIYYFAKP